MTGPIVIGFDEAHKPRGKLDSNYKSLAQHLNQNGFLCTPFAEFPITRQNLAPYDIIVFACPDFSKISKQEIDAIKSWVREDGGGVLMLSHAGGDKGRRSNLTELGEQFGQAFESDQVLDKNNNLGVENLPIIRDFGFPHPITEGLEELCYRAGCSLMMLSPQNTPVVSSTPNAEPSETPLILAGEHNDGRVVSIGSYEMFRDKITGGFSHASHAQFALNVMNWLKSAKREQLRASGAIPTPSGFSATGIPAQGSASNIVSSPTQAFQNGGTQIPQFGGQTGGMPTFGVPVITYETNVKIMAKEQLFKAFEDALTGLFSFKDRMMAEFETLKTNMENLMRTVIASEQDVIVLNQQQAPAPVNSTQNAGVDSILTSLANLGASATNEAPTTTASPAPAPGLSAPPGLKPPPGREAITPSTAEGLPTLSPLPMRPGSSGGFSPPPSFEAPPTYEAPSDSGYQAPVDYSSGWANANPEPDPNSSSAPVKEAAAPKIEELPRNKEELQAELDSLENKLNSIRNLRSFVEKKLQAGKLSQSEYDKQIKKLDSDTSKAKYRIDEIKAILAKL